MTFESFDYSITKNMIYKFLLERVFYYQHILLNPNKPCIENILTVNIF